MDLSDSSEKIPSDTTEDRSGDLHNFNVESVIYSYMLQLFHTNHNQAAWQENKKAIILLYYITMCDVRMFEKLKIR
jgi:hypothetical protein